MGSFDGLQIGSTGLGAQRRGVQTAGQNIANVNTEGYTRQRVGITADSGPITPAFHSTWSSSGLGVRSVEVMRLRDAFVDQRMREEAALGADLTARADAYRSIERILDEPSDTGLSSVLGEFLAAWDDLANQPGDIGARTQVIERGATLANSVNELDKSLTGLRDATRTNLEATIARVNADAAQVASIQQTTMSAGAAGVNTAELLDERDLLLERIATAVGGTVHHQPDGSATVLLGGTALVRGSTATALEVQVADDGQATVAWSLDGRAAPVAGAAGGLQQVVNQVVPQYRESIAQVAGALAAEVNEVHQRGLDRNGLPGLEFFVFDATGTLRVNDAIRSDPTRVAAARQPDPFDPLAPPQPSLDGSIASELAGIGERSLPGGVDSTYRELVVRLGVESQATQRRSQLQTNIVSQVRAEQEAASGVNLDEELSDLVRFQRAYEASARFITAVDQLLDTLINGTGRVGR